MEASKLGTSTLIPLSAGNVITAFNGSGQSLSIPTPFQTKILLVADTHIAGTTHVRNIDAIAAEIEEGAELKFVREPDNLADRWAIRVFAGKTRLGYVPADCNEILARLMDGGKALSGKLIEKEKLGKWNKLHMEVSLDD